MSDKPKAQDTYIEKPNRPGQIKPNRPGDPRKGDKPNDDRRR